MANGRERVEAALALDVADRPPVSAWGHNYDLEWDPSALAAETVDRTRRLGFDFVKLQIRATSFAEAFGADYRYSGDPARAPVGEPPIEGADAWSRFGERAVRKSVFDEQVECLRLVCSGLGRDVPVIQTVFSPITVAGFLAKRVLDDLRSSPRTVFAALDYIASALIDFCTASLEAGAAGAFYAITGYGSADALPLAEYEELLLPLDRKVLDACSAGWFNMLHLCGPRQHFELARKLPAQSVNWQLQDEGNPTLSEGRRLSGKAVAGGLHRHTPIADGTPEHVLAQSSAALLDSGPRGFLLTPGCSVSPWPREREENFSAMFKALV
jgi:uroporphyrinogen decarboxylase